MKFADVPLVSWKCPKCDSEVIKYLDSIDIERGYYELNNRYCIHDGNMMEPTHISSPVQISERIANK